MSTPNRMELYWNETREFIKKEWPKLSATSLHRINGNFDLFLKYLKESYNNFPLEEAKARDKLQRFLNSIENQL